jgi:hypothetical protein
MSTQSSCLPSRVIESFSPPNHERCLLARSTTVVPLNRRSKRDCQDRPPEYGDVVPVLAAAAFLLEMRLVQREGAGAERAAPQVVEARAVVARDQRVAPGEVEAAAGFEFHLVGKTERRGDRAVDAQLGLLDRLRARGIAPGRCEAGGHEAEEHLELRIPVRAEPQRASAGSTMNAPIT